MFSYNDYDEEDDEGDTIKFDEEDNEMLVYVIYDDDILEIYRDENFETLMSTYMYDSIGLYPNHPDVFYSITYTGIFDELVKIRHIGLKRYLLK